MALLNVESDGEVDLLEENRRATARHEADIEKQRSEWWLSTMKATPNPGTYETSGFLEELNKNPVNVTYSFKTVGRKNSAYPFGRGAVLMPGLYSVKDSYSVLQQRPATYNFKAPQRQTLTTYSRAPPPNKYHLESYSTFDGTKANAKLSSFKTEVQRFPVFKPRDGPGPGEYEPKLLRQDSVITSSFTSKDPRFKSAVSKVPGPGSYDKCCYDKSRKHVNTILKDMGRKNGLFFSYSPMI